MIDLHTHSRASDGSFTPGELIAHASSQGVSVLALTDHDTVEGNEEASQAAVAAGIRFIPGIELDIEWRPGECHVLGLGLINTNPDLVNLLIRLQEGRLTRNTAIVEKMKEAGIDIDLSRVEAIAEIRASGGVPILAHPLSLYVSWGSLPGLIQDFRDKGIAGLEAWHPGARIAECERLEKLAHSLGMCVTAGSDFHGAARPDRKIGKTAGQRVIDDKYFFEGLAQLLES